MTPTSKACGHQDSPSWTRAKKSGDRGEAIVADLFEQLGYTVCHGPKTNPEYDLELRTPNGTRRIEIKTDLRASKTGNVAIELSRDGAPSGLHSTTAHAWVILVEATVYLIPTARLKAMATGDGVRVVRCGDGTRTRCALVPVESIRQAEGVRIWQVRRCAV